MNPLEQMRAGVEAGVDEDPDRCLFECGFVKCRLAQKSGGAEGLQAAGQGLNADAGLYIFAAGDAAWREGEVFARRGKRYQIGAVARTSFFGGAAQTLAQVAEVSA